MIIDQIDIRGVALLKAKNNPPVGAYCDAPIFGQIALQRMQVEAGYIELIRSRCLIEARQHAGDLVRVLRVQLAPVVVFIRAAAGRDGESAGSSMNDME